MKQYISEDQFNEVSIEKQQKFYDDIKFQSIHLTAPVIGQMIDFLYRNTTVIIECDDRESPTMGWTVNGKYKAVELADALWMVVREQL